MGMTLTTQTRKILGTAKPKTLLHPSRLRLPVHLLDMVTANGQHVSSTLAAALQHLPPGAGSHTGAEAMDALATTNLRLPGSLRHAKHLTQKCLMQGQWMVSI